MFAGVGSQSAASVTLVTAPVGVIGEPEELTSVKNPSSSKPVEPPAPTAIADAFSPVGLQLEVLVQLPFGPSVTVPMNAPPGMFVPLTGRPSSVILTELSWIVDELEEPVAESVRALVSELVAVVVA